MNSKILLENIERDDLDEVLFSALRSIHKLERSKVTRFDLNYEAIYLLQYLRRHSPARMSDIADELLIPVSTATRMVDRLESRNLLSRKQDQNDKRIMLVSLRAKGENIVREVERDTFNIISENLKGFTEEQIRCFIETALHLEKLLKIPGS